MEEKEGKVLSWFKRNFTVKAIVENALVAALYAVVTIACGSLSYVGGSLQLRFSEMLNLLVFFNPSYTVGLTIGCLLANLCSIYSVYDIVLGTIGTLVSCLLIVLISKTIKNLFLSSLMPCIINALIVPFIVYLSSVGMELTPAIYFVNFGWTFLGEFICITCIGYPIFLVATKKSNGFLKIIDAKQNFKYLF